MCSNARIGRWTIGRPASTRRLTTSLAPTVFTPYIGSGVSWGTAPDRAFRRPQHPGNVWRGVFHLVRATTGQAIRSCSISFTLKPSAVLTERGFRAAARDLKLSPSTVVEHIKQLEGDSARRCLCAVAELSNLPFKARPSRRLPARCSIPPSAPRGRPGTPAHCGVKQHWHVCAIHAGCLSGDRPVFRRSVDWSRPPRDRLANGAADVALMEWWSDRPGFCEHSWRREPLVIIVAPVSLGRPGRDRGKRTRQPDPFGGEAGTDHAAEKGVGTIGGRFDRHRRFWKHRSGQAGRPRGPRRFTRDSGGGGGRNQGGTARRPAPEGYRTRERVEGYSPIGLPDAAPAARFVAHAERGLRQLIRGTMRRENQRAIYCEMSPRGSVPYCIFSERQVNVPPA